MKKCDNSWKCIVTIITALLAVSAAVAAFIIYREQIEKFFARLTGCCAETVEKIGGKINEAKEKVVVKCCEAKGKICPNNDYTEEELSDFADV